MKVKDATAKIEYERDVQTSAQNQNVLFTSLNSD